MLGLGWEGLATAETVRAVHARRNAASVAGMVSGLYFAALWSRGVGGPVLNVLYYIGIQAFVPDRVYALGGTPPEHAFTRAATEGLNATSSIWLRDASILVGPGVVAFGLALTYWIRSLSPEGQEHFATDHLPEAWLRLRETE